MKYSLIILAILISTFICPVQSYSYGDKKTHPAITNKALEKSQLNDYLINHLGMEKGLISIANTKGKTIMDLIKTGSTNEDLLFRAFNHFYDPLKGSPLDSEGGLDDTFLGWPVKGIPNPYWAFTNDKPCDCLNPFNDNNCNEFTWKLSDRKIQG